MNAMISHPDLISFDCSIKLNENVMSLPFVIKLFDISLRVKLNIIPAIREFIINLYVF